MSRNLKRNDAITHVRYKSHLGVPKTFLSSSVCSSRLRVAKASSARGRPLFASGAEPPPPPPRPKESRTPSFLTTSLTDGRFLGQFRNFFTFRLFSTIFPVFFFLGLASRLALLITGVALDLNLVLTLGLILPSLSTRKLSEDSALCRSPEFGATSLFKLWSVGRVGSLWRGVRAALKESLLVV